MAQLMGRKGERHGEGDSGLGFDSEKKCIEGERPVGEAYIREVGDALPEFSIAPVNLQVTIRGEEVVTEVNTSTI